MDRWGGIGDEVGQEGTREGRERKEEWKESDRKER